MRKGQRSRRKNATPMKSTQAPLPEANVGNVGATMEKERKSSPVVTENEAALAAKNYRLAKELSELRQRAKEEAKAVTNLTMQNMNLASRCRQALSHVESLRKELARYQKQGQGHSTLTSPANEIVPMKDDRRGVPVSSHYANEVAPRRDENRIFGRTLRSPNVSNAPSRVPQDNYERNTNTTSTTMTSLDGIDGNDRVVNGNDNDVAKTMVSKAVPTIQEETAKSKIIDNGYILSQEMEGHDLDMNNIDLVENNLQKTTSSPETPPPVTPETDEETPSPPTPDDEEIDFDRGETDITFGELRSEDFFHQTYESTLPATPEKENIDVEAMNRQFDSFNISEQGDEKQAKAKKGMNGKDEDKGSFDAFEASFQTTFPSSFAESTSPSNFGGTEFSDSFFLEGSRSDSAKKKNKSPKKRRDDPDPAMDAPMDEAMELFPNPALTSFEPFETPSKSSANELTSSPTAGSSRNNNSNAGLSVRARFERKQRKAIESSPPNAPMDEAQADENGEHSPTLVLKRLKQRQAKANSTHSSPSAVSAKGISISEEIRKLDAIATSIPTSREKPRRNVSRPTSYAEPSLSSKLRRGDVFFSKENNVGLNNSKSNSNGEGDQDLQKGDQDLQTKVSSSPHKET